MAGRGARLASRAARLMTDTCVIERAAAGSTNAAGYQTTAYQDSAPMRCKLVVASVDETEETTAQRPDGRATVWLPAQTLVANVDRIRVTHRDGVPLPRPLRWSVTGTPDLGPVATVVTLEPAILTADS